jgi:AraC family transcriptional regulator of adaptative response/methylated-DNA-[protein]-cysteine methyltransferase
MMYAMKSIPAPAKAYSDDERWSAVMRRDADANGTFYYAVKTTGVYCLPSCASKRPLRTNVEFFGSAAEARAGGYRPCKRCRPDGNTVEEQQAQKIAAACKLIEDSDSVPTLNELAAAAGMSSYHFHRVFKAVTGLTPKAYAVAHRAERMQQALSEGGSVTRAVYDAGFNSTGRFYEATDRALGMTPSAFRAGGEGMRIRFGIGACSLGAILVAATSRGICSIVLGNDAEAVLHELQDRFPKAELVGGDREFENWMATVIGFVEAPEHRFDLPLDVQGTTFQRRVWQALTQIPVGSRVSYAEIAKKIGAPRAVRAVAQACAQNTIAVAIPCHRVVRTDGSLSGYRWGVERKRALLDRESKQGRLAVEG